MIETWGSVARVIVLAWGLAALVPVGVYVMRRAISRSRLAEDRDQRIINGSAREIRAIPKPPPAHDD